MRAGYLAESSHTNADIASRKFTVSLFEENFRVASFPVNSRDEALDIIAAWKAGTYKLLVERV